MLLERRDEIGALMRSVEQAGLNMKSLVGDIQVKAQRVLSAAAGLVEEHARLSDRCAQAAASLEETAASMEEIQAGMEATMQGIDAAGDLARRCAGQAIDSQRQVDQVVDAMGHITEASQRIGEITVLIDGIAFQTNVLALNAAVEAARAGEHGRGFAVVAGEVRSLSRRSVEAAREIRQLIQACGEAVAQGQREAAQAGATMAAVVGGVRELDAVMAGLRLAAPPAVCRCRAGRRGDRRAGPCHAGQCCTGRARHALAAGHDCRGAAPARCRPGVLRRWRGPARLRALGVQRGVTVRDDASDSHLHMLELVARHTTNMVVVTNSRREIEWVTPTYTRITGWSLDEVRGRNPRTFLHGPRTSLVAASILGTRLRRGEPVEDFELLNYKKSGEPYWVSLNIQPVRDATGRVTHYVAIQSDVTERKRRELEVTRAHRRMQEAQRMARLASMEHELGSGTLWVTPQARHLLGLDERARSFEDWMARVHPGDVAAVRARYQAALREGRPYEDEYRLLHPRDGVRWVQVHGVLADPQEGGAPTCRLAIQDITDRKQAELMAREKARVEEAARAQAQMLSRITHDFREPLHAILGFAELIERQDGGRLSDASRGHLRQIDRSARHLLALVGDILDLGAARGGQLRLRLRPVPIGAAVHQVVELLRPLALERQVALAVNEPSDGLQAQADPQRLEQVLINLVGNAIKYNRPGGRVEIAVSVQPSGRVAVAVQDTGPGIAPEALGRLFEAYYRVVPAPDGPGGSGLGLAIARGLARAMGGDIVAESEPGTGSVFTLTLPPATAGDVVEASAGHAVADAGRRPPVQVLYVDDNDLNRLLVESYLATRPGYSLAHCATGRAALAWLRRSRPHLVLLDMHLPDMTGLEVLQQLQRAPSLQGIPCVKLSLPTTRRTASARWRPAVPRGWPSPWPARTSWIASRPCWPPRRHPPSGQTPSTDCGLERLTKLWKAA